MGTRLQCTNTQSSISLNTTHLSLNHCPYKSLCYFTANIFIGLEIYDTLRFFTGDHPAAAFERGTQQGGMYPCGDCGISASLIDDQAHSLRKPHRTLQELQSTAISGKLGKALVFGLQDADKVQWSFDIVGCNLYKRTPCQFKKLNLSLR